MLVLSNLEYLQDDIFLHNFFLDGVPILQNLNTINQTLDFIFDGRLNWKLIRISARIIIMIVARVNIIINHFLIVTSSF